MRYPKLRELKEAVKSLISRPYTNDFPRKPHKPFERFRGKPEYDQDHCMGCTACVQVCPARALEFQDEVVSGKGKRTLTIRWDICIFCGQCQANCPTEKGIVLSNDFDLAKTEDRKAMRQKIDKELLLCEYCSEIIAPKDQILWVARKIGPLVFSNASLMLFYLGNLGLSGQDIRNHKQEGELKRADRIKVLCPRCRREAVLKS
jgi:hydrogenase-4 component H